MELIQGVKFENAETGKLCGAVLVWDTGRVQFIIVSAGSEGQRKAPFVAEITRQGEDGIFRRAADYTLDEEAEDVFRLLRELAANLNASEEGGIERQ